MSDQEIIRYNDAELAEFKEIIQSKISNAKEELNIYQEQIKSTGQGEHSFNNLEDGSLTLEREKMNQVASRLIKHIQHLENALIRIENKTYGICRVTGKLIPKERLKVVPHATLSVEAKEQRGKNKG
ncbi:MAG TPA: TraR/DksA C4-type zinc finger protein [Chitinophagales bacterium]|nr:TraR/DksA C4-type zinc finger protein [Chitinophagales bacterium]